MRRDSIFRAPTICIILFVCALLSSCTPLPLYQATQAPCATWQITSSPNPGNIGDQLESVFAVANNNIWVAGSATDTSNDTESVTLVEHWDGKSWSVTPGPNPNRVDESNYPDSLRRITGSSANDLWAVGEGHDGLLEHWNGHAWSVSWSIVDTPVVPSPVTSYQFSFSSVAALSPTDAWVVGSAVNRASSIYSGDRTLTAHWDGHAWSLVPHPDLHAGFNGTTLDDVTALAPDNVWAVGNTSPKEGSQLALIEHWDGQAWSVVSSPQPQGTARTSSANLWSLAALSPNDIWAGGFYTVDSVNHYLVEHWDGHAWNLLPVAIQGKNQPYLRQIVAVSDQNVWAVNSDSSLLHWNGSSWSISSLPHADQYGYSIASMAALPNGKLWLVGTVRNPTGPGPRTLIATSCL